MTETLTENVVRTRLSGVMDPELHIAVTDLGLIYGIVIEGKTVSITFTLTYPGCPLADELERRIRKAVRRIRGVKSVETRLVWEPAWGPEMMSETARFSLGYEI